MSPVAQQFEVALEQDAEASRAQFLARLRSVEFDPADRDMFTAALARAIEGFGIAPETLAKEFATSPTTVRRWGYGESAPRYPVVRKAVIDWIIARLSGR